MSCVNDLRILQEMCQEIKLYKITQLPGNLGLYRFLETQRGKEVGQLLEKLAISLLEEQFKHQQDVEKLQVTIDGLRSENQQLTDSLLSKI